MVSYDFTASEVSFNPATQMKNDAGIERSVSLRGPSDRARSKSRDRTSPVDKTKPLTSHPVDPGVTDEVPPVPPLPKESDLATSEGVLKSRSVSLRDSGDGGKKTRTQTQRDTSGKWEPEAGAAGDLQGLLDGIIAHDEDDEKATVKPPY